MGKNMKKIYDSETDSLMIIFKKGEEEYYEEIAPGINMEFDKNGNVIGIEVLNASKYKKRETSEPIVKSNFINSPIELETGARIQSFDARFYSSI